MVFIRHARTAHAWAVRMEVARSIGTVGKQLMPTPLQLLDGLARFIPPPRRHLYPKSLYQIQCEPINTMIVIAVPQNQNGKSQIEDSDASCAFCGFPRG